MIFFSFALSISISGMIVRKITLSRHIMERKAEISNKIKAKTVKELMIMEYKF